jgi:hypothetical protein
MQSAVGRGETDTIRSPRIVMHPPGKGGPQTGKTNRAVKDVLTSFMNGR